MKRFWEIIFLGAGHFCPVYRDHEFQTGGNLALRFRDSVTPREHFCEVTSDVRMKNGVLLTNMVLSLSYIWHLKNTPLLFLKSIGYVMYGRESRFTQ